MAWHLMTIWPDRFGLLFGRLSVNLGPKIILKRWGSFCSAGVECVLARVSGVPGAAQTPQIDCFWMAWYLMAMGYVWFAVRPNFDQPWPQNLSKKKGARLVVPVVRVSVSRASGAPRAAQTPQIGGFWMAWYLMAIWSDTFGCFPADFRSTLAPKSF